MYTTINPRRFLGQELTLSPLARGQSAVLLDGLRIGRISHAPDPEKREVWLWTLTGPHCDSIPANMPVVGEAATLTEAKLKLRSSLTPGFAEHWRRARPCGGIGWRQGPHCSAIPN